MAFIIYSPGVHTEVFLAQTDAEEQAWILFVEQVHDYQEQPDGSFRHKTIFHEDLQEALDMYGLTKFPDGSYSNANAHFASLQEAQAAYGIEESETTFTSSDRSYPNLISALRTISPEAHRLEIAPITINPTATFQALFGSKDEWDYVECNPEEDVKKDILSQHRWQAERYERLNLLPDVLAELKQGLNISTSVGDKIYFHQYLGRLLFKMGKLPSAARHYESALLFQISIGERSLLHYRVAEIYYQLGKQKKALQHYQNADFQDLRDEEIAKVKERMLSLR